MKAHLNLIKHAIKEMDFSITVDWGEDDNDAIKSKSIKEVFEASEACDDCHLFFYDNQSNPQGWAYIVLGNDGGDEVSDFAVCDWLNDWADKVYWN